MDRRALLLYLRDLRDLEFAKAKITSIKNKQSSFYNKSLKALGTPNLQYVPFRETVSSIIKKAIIR